MPEAEAPFTAHDNVYETLVEMLDGLSTQDALKLTLKVILILSCEIGDEKAVKQAAAAARKNTSFARQDQ